MTTTTLTRRVSARTLTPYELAQVLAELATGHRPPYLDGLRIRSLARSGLSGRLGTDLPHPTIEWLRVAVPTCDRFRQVTCHLVAGPVRCVLAFTVSRGGLVTDALVIPPKGNI